MQGKELSLYQCCITPVANSSDKQWIKCNLHANLQSSFYNVNCRLLEIFLSKYHKMLLL